MSYTHEVVGLRYSDMIKTKDEINDNIDGCEAYYNSDFFGVIVLSTNAMANSIVIAEHPLYAGCKPSVPKSTP